MLEYWLTLSFSTSHEVSASCKSAVLAVTC